MMGNQIIKVMHLNFAFVIYNLKFS